MDDSPAAQIDPATDVQDAATFDINAYNATVNTIRRRLTILEKAKKELKTITQMHQDIFVNDPLYQETETQVKEANRKKKDIKTNLAKQPNAVKLYSQIKELKDQIKANEESLAQELMEYYKTAGVMEIETEDGQVQEFKLVVKLKPRKKRE